MHGGPTRSPPLLLDASAPWPAMATRDPSPSYSAERSFCQWKPTPRMGKRGIPVTHSKEHNLLVTLYSEMSTSSPGSSGDLAWPKSQRGLRDARKGRAGQLPTLHPRGTAPGLPDSVGSAWARILPGPPGPFCGDPHLSHTCLSWGGCPLRLALLSLGCDPYLECECSCCPGFPLGCTCAHLAMGPTWASPAPPWWDHPPGTSLLRAVWAIMAHLGLTCCMLTVLPA